MRLHLLHLDDALESQPDFRRACLDAGASEIEAKREGRHLRLWGRPGELDGLRMKVAAGFERGGGKPSAPLTFYGSGDFHHVTALLLDVVLDDLREPVTVLHFDNHPDWVRFDNGMHCGSWVNRALAHPKVDKVVTVGVCSDDLVRPEWKGANLEPLRDGRLEVFPYHRRSSTVRNALGDGASHSQQGRRIYWRTIADCGEENFAAELVKRIRTEAVYITLDKDVLEPKSAATNWDQGRMPLAYLFTLLRAIAARHRLAGADVTGDYSRPDYAGSLLRRAMTRAEILIDQPLRRPDPANSARLNGAVNRKLLDIFSELMEA